ncbi:MAG: endopeptidase La [Alphaproteobacteria bacterium]
MTNERLPLLPLRDIVVFPQMIATLFVGRSKSVVALEEAIRLTNRHVIVVTQKESIVDEPTAKDLHKIGTIGQISEMVNLPDGTVKVLIEGKHRATIENVDDKGPFMWGEASTLISPLPDQETLYVLDKLLITEFEEYAKFNKKITPEFIANLFALDDIEKVIDTVSMQIPLTIPERQDLLERLPIKDRMELVLFFLKREIESSQTEEKIRERIKAQMAKNHREYYLQEQMKAIQKELHNEDGKDEMGILEQKINATPLSAEAKKKAQDELRKLRAMNPMSAEASVIRNYLDWLLEIPWEKSPWKKFTLKQAEETLDQDHYGLKKVKERILEFLSVQQRLAQPKGQIICLVGPPGVGKTSLAKSIAKVTQRPYVRVALGGVHDESEIRGHRRTYIGSMPGKIVQGMKKAKSTNPLFLLDEIDKMGTDWRGDPASALLEVLDPEQNKHFNDHYLEVDYDLSNVMFLATANSLNLPRPLLDRMEIISIEGYTEEEKLQIALGYLVEKQKTDNAVKKEELAFTNDALLQIIRSYTREAGVRGLERQIASLCRKAVRQLADKKVSSITITPENLQSYLGPIKYQFEKAENVPQVGVTTGLAWTEMGGDLLYIEAVKSEGKGKINITGKLGEVMQESVKASLSYVKSRAAELGIDPAVFGKIDIHLHVPEGATPKDGPSAGVSISTTLVSLLTGIPVKSCVAMTGEITLRGLVFPIGGLKEKLLAAQRGGIKTVLIPKENEKDLVEIPESILKSLKIIPVETLTEVLAEALVNQPQPFVDLIASDAPPMSSPATYPLPPTAVHH